MEMKRIFIVLLFFLASQTGCETSSYVDSETLTEESLSVEAFSKKPEDFSNKRIKVRGFLNASGPGLYLSEDQRGAPNRGDAIVFIFDPKLRFTMGNEGYTVDGEKREIKCTGKYAEVVGRTGFVDEFGIIAIKVVELIVIYDTKDFQGEGEVCYEQNK